MKRNRASENVNAQAGGKRDTARRIEMEFGVAADAYRSDPSKKATRNGVIALQIIVAAIVFVLVVAGFYLATNEVGIVSLLVAALAALAMLLSFHIALEWERAVVLRFGRFTRVAGPGVFFTIPLVEYCALRVDQRMMVTPFGAEETLTSDLIPLDVDAVLSWMIWNPELACTEVEDCHFAVALAAQTALRDAIGRAPVSEVVVRRNQLDHELRAAIEEKVSDGASPSSPWRFGTSSCRRSCRAYCRSRRKPSAAGTPGSCSWRPRRTCPSCCRRCRTCIARTTSPWS